MTRGQAPTPFCPTHGRRPRSLLAREEAISRMKEQRAELRALLARRPPGLAGRAAHMWAERAKQCHHMLDEFAEELVRGPRCLCEWDQLENLSWLISRLIGQIRLTTTESKEPA